MEFIPYSCQQITEDDIAAVVDVLRSEYLTQGPAVPAFEGAFARRHAVAHAVAVSNATAGLHIACLALGVGPGSMVWTSPNTFLASANCARYCGADVGFVDIDPHTRNMSVLSLAAKLEEAQSVGRLPDVVVPVDFSGLPANLREIRALADRYDFRILQDASHAAGGSYQGAPVGSQYSDVSVFSFHAVKIVTTGEGGMVTTHDASLARQLQLLRSHGMTREAEELTHSATGPWYYEQQLLGFNYRMTDIQAALGLSQLARMDALHARRVELADRYDSLLAGLPLKLPARMTDRVSSWHLYAVEMLASPGVATRLAVFERLRALQIGVNVHYIPVHLQPYYAKLGFRRGEFPAAEAYYDAAISLPLFPALTDVQQDRVSVAVREALAA